MPEKLLNSSESPLSQIQFSLQRLASSLDGEVFSDSLTRKLYATDASVYEELPAAVAIPRSDRDLQKLIHFASEQRIGLIPRTAGTSLAGQVVGSGLVVDLSRHFGRILELNVEERWVRVQPGVIRDELNRELKPHGLTFGPETSTSNRAMIGGMVGNNSCGARSMIYGTTRECTLELHGFLSDGSRVTFKAISEPEYEQKCKLDTLEGKLYREALEMLSDKQVQKNVATCFPKPTVLRRNTGYAIDRLLDCSLFGNANEPFNFCRLIAGSEGTLFLATEITLRLESLPPDAVGVLGVHFESLSEALHANTYACRHPIYASELLDRKIIEGAKRNNMQRDHLALVEGAPEAILAIELRGDSVEEVEQQAKVLKQDISSKGWGVAFPLFLGDDVAKLWSLRKAGLGVVANVESDEKPVTVIEDTAVAVDDLPAYIGDVHRLMTDKYQCECVYYGHAGSGEIHLRPVLDLRTPRGVELFREIATDFAALVKRYRGSLSGEHGDGRLRSEFITSMVGESNYRLMSDFKTLFDPQRIFNPGKIIDSPPMDRDLRLKVNPSRASYETVFDFGEGRDLLSAAELCSGSGDCRKTELAGGGMCPSFHATRNEVDSTRARANVLRHVLAESIDPKRSLGGEEVMAVMDLCLSCKACKSECPSNVDMSKMKAEFLQAYYDANGVPGRVKRIADISRFNRWGTRFPRLMNFLTGSAWARWFRDWNGLARQRRIPKFSSQNLMSWFGTRATHRNAGKQGRVFFFCDEFTSYTEPEVGIAAIELLERLGWQVELVTELESGRASISNGLLRKAQGIAQRNVERLASSITDESPLISVEPSAILSFRDEYPDLLRGGLRNQATELGKNCLNLEEFIDQKNSLGQISRRSFCDEPRLIRLHGHCHQKAIVGLAPTVRALQLPKNYRVRLIPSGCCGMAGAFGMEDDHYELSMKIGELILFPTVRKEPDVHAICATGTSCRQQIREGTGRRSFHPAQILREALVDE